MGVGDLGAIHLLDPLAELDGLHHPATSRKGLAVGDEPLTVVINQEEVLAQVFRYEMDPEEI